MSTISDKEFSKLFDTVKQREIADNGFTRNVMAKIPKQDRKTHPIVVWAFGLIGVLIAYFSGAIFSCLASLACFGFQLSHAHMPTHTTLIVYLLVLGSILTMSANVIKKSWS